MTRLPTFGLFLITALMPCRPLCAEEKPKFTDWLVDPVDAKRDRVVPLKLYVPNTDKPVPVVLFSHGLGGSRENNSFVGRYWAEAGYVAVFIQHIGSDETVWRNAAPQERAAVMQEAASAKSTQDRHADVPFVIDQLEKWNREEGNPLHGKMNLAKIGMSGHSFGAVTTQGMMGQRLPANRNYHDPRLSAFVLFSPSSHRATSPEEAFGQIAKPVLCMTGTKDLSGIERGSILSPGSGFTRRCRPGTNSSSSLRAGNTMPSGMQADSAKSSNRIITRRFRNSPQPFGMPI